VSVTNLSNEDADYLLKLPKKVFRNDTMLDEVFIQQVFGMKVRHVLASEEDDEFTFLWEITQSAKNLVRVSLHYQDNDTKIGLLRVDFNSGHKNPENVNEFVPGKFIPYAGKDFLIQGHHIHYHVQGYSSLAWAVPLSEDEFEIKELNDGANFNVDFGKIIILFAKTINLQTNINFGALLL